MAEYTARDLRVAKRVRIATEDAASIEAGEVAIATALAAERKRALRGMERLARKEAALYKRWRDNTNKDHHRATWGEWERGRYVASELAQAASRRARGSK